jgi:hypothetical protein
VAKMRKEAGFTDNLHPETGLPETGAPHCQQNRYGDSDISGFQSTGPAIKQAEASINSSVYRSDMPFPADVLPEFSFDSFTVKILTLGFLVILVAAFLAVYP